MLTKSGQRFLKPLKAPAETVCCEPCSQRVSPSRVGSSFSRSFCPIGCNRGNSCWVHQRPQDFGPRPSTASALVEYLPAVTVPSSRKDGQSSKDTTGPYVLMPKGQVQFLIGYCIVMLLMTQFLQHSHKYQALLEPLAALFGSLLQICISAFAIENGWAI